MLQIRAFELVTGPVFGQASPPDGLWVSRWSSAHPRALMLYIVRNVRGESPWYTTALTDPSLRIAKLAPLT